MSDAPIAQPFAAGDTPAPWSEARRRLETAGTYWLVTAGAGGSPRVRPLLAVWVDGALHVSAGPGTRKAADLARDARCAIATGTDAFDLVVEGEAVRVRDETALRRVADAYASKYEWEVEVRDGALHGEGAPTAGPPPYAVYRMTPATVLGFPRDESVTATRWRFRGGDGAP